MLFKSNSNVYIEANNKFYKVEVVNGNLVPTKDVKYKLDKKTEISAKDAKELLEKENKKTKFNLD